jgi:transposase
MPKTVSLDGRLEACGGAHYSAQRFIEHGHTVLLIIPRFVKPFAKTYYNNWNDAATICEAAQRPTTRFVVPKTIFQQKCLALHRIRRRQVIQRTAIANQARDLLQEHAVAVACSPNQSIERGKQSSFCDSPQLSRLADICARI